LGSKDGVSHLEAFDFWTLSIVRCYFVFLRM